MAVPRNLVRPAPSKGSSPSVETDPADATRAALGRVLASETFQQADRLKRFLTFIVEEAIAGRQTELKEYVIGVHVFRKEDTFDPRTDPIVRVQARRLRAKLVRYYREEGQGEALRIDLPKGGYAPLFKPREAPTLLKHSPAGSLVGRNTLFVQPFSNHSAEQSLDYFCKAVHDEVIHQLAQLRDLRLVSALDADDAVRASVVLSGSIRQFSGRVRATVQLIDGATGYYIWSESVTGTADDAFAAQEEIAAAVARRIGLELGAGRRVNRLARPAENLAAKNLYLQGRYHLNQRTEDGLVKAVEFFEKSLSEGAEYAPAHSGLADAFGLQAHYGVRPPPDVWTEHASHAATAVMLDDLSAEAHTSLAHVKATQDWDWTGAEREFLRAISLNPEYATAHHWYANSCLAPLGRLDEALDEIVTAQSLDPVSSIVARDLAVIHFYRRDFETALEQCDHTIELNPHFAPAYLTLGVIQEQRRDFDESEAAFQRAIHLSPNAPRMHSALGRTYALSGRRSLAVEILRKLEAYAAERYVSPVEFAWIYFALGDFDHGFASLAKACDDRSFDLLLINVDPRFDPLRGDDRFATLARRLHLG